jgi:two-component system LytT family sensor kinase
MSNLHEPQIVNILGHSAGAIIFGIFLYLLVRDRAGTRLWGSRLSVAASSLAFLWNIGSLSVLIASSTNSGYARLVVFLSFSALSLLPAILLHLSLDGSFRPIIAAGYALSLVAVGMHLLELSQPAKLYGQHALLLITVGFAILTILAALGMVLHGPDAGKARAPRLFGAMCSCLLAMSLVHFGSDHPAQAWSSELVLHHAGIPLALFVLLQDYRFVLLDAFARFLANVLVAAALTFVAIRITFRWAVVDQRVSGSPTNEALLLLSLTLLLIGFAVVRGHVQRWLTQVVFRRPDLDRALREIESRGALPGEELAFVTWAGEYLAQFFRADRVELVPEQRLIRIPGLSGLMFPAPASDVPALRNTPELAWAEAIAPLPGAQGESQFLLLGRRRGGRRYLSEDLQALSRLTAAVVSQIERFRNSEMQRLVSQAELRALQAQINPHFLFNVLNTLYGIIPRTAPGARQTVLNLSEIFRYFLQSERTFIRLSDELEIVKSYLEIERLRIGPRLETQIQVDEAALGVQIPVLCIQPLVENAIKHGIAPKAGRGILSVTAKAVDGEVLIAVQDSSAGTIGANPPFERSGAGVGLANVRRRLQLCFGAQADVVIDSGPTGTCVQFAIPLNPAPRAPSGEVETYNEVR